MYNYPYGGSQQINLNWIISEIIALHQRLDPDYTAPTFTQIYPFSDTQQLNLDWILTELKALKDLAPTPPEEIDEIGQALIAGAYDATTSYQKNDYIVQDGKLYRANAATTGTFDPTKWNEVMLGNDLAIITRWADATNTYLNSLAASNVANDSSVTGTTVKDALDTLKNDVSGMTTDDVANESGVTGATATAALNNLNGAITDKEKATFSGLGMFNRIGVIGDSYATGGINLGSASYVVDSSWINVIGRNLGIAATRYAKGGYNTRKFVTSTEQDYNTVGLGKLLSDITVKNTCGLYIFALGINDTTLGTSYIGSASDINLSDPTQNADTFYGNAGKILSNIISNAPNSKIIMSTFYRPPTSTSEQTLFDAFNTAIIGIANKFSVPYIDIRTDEFFKSSYYANGIRNSHPTLDLYVGYANAMMRMCAKAIVDNNAYFYDYKNTQIYNDTYYHSGEVMVFTSVYAQFFAIANNATQLRIFIPLNKPVKATSFTMEGGFYARSPNEASAINGTIVSETPTGNDAVFGNATIVDNGIAFTLTFASGTLTARQVYGVATSSQNPLTLTFT